MTFAATNSDRDRVLAATDILSVIGEVIALRPKGNEHQGLCPFHEDGSPSFSVVTHKSSYGGGGGFYNCFACPTSGNVIDFVMAFHRMSFREALVYLAERAKIELTPFRGHREARVPGEPTPEDILIANGLARNFYRRVFEDTSATANTAGVKARAEVERRGFSETTIDEFQIGAAHADYDRLARWVQRNLEQHTPDFPSLQTFVLAGLIRASQSGSGYHDFLRNRLVFPICDDLNRVIAFGARKLDDDQQPKYLNSPETPVFHKSRALYGINRAKRAIIASKQAIVTEGYTDVIACHRAGVTNAVATLGTALTREHARRLSLLTKNVVLLFDGDQAGQRAADRAVEIFFSEAIDIKICVLPDNLDPDDLLRQEDGVRRFREALDNAVDALPFMTSRLQAQLKGAGISNRQEIIQKTITKFLDLGINTMSSLRRQLVMQSLAELFRLNVYDLETELQRAAATMRKPSPANDSAFGAPENGRNSVVEVPLNLRGNAAQTAGLRGAGPLGVSRGSFRAAQIAAENRLLAVLCLNPALIAVAVPIEGDAPLALSEAMTPQMFVDEGHFAIFAAIRNAHEDGRVLTFEQLLGDLGTPSLKHLASNLYRFGVQAVDAAAVQTGGTSASSNPATELIVSWKDLESLARRERFRNPELGFHVGGAAITSRHVSSPESVAPACESSLDAAAEAESRLNSPSDASVGSPLGTLDSSSPNPPADQSDQTSDNPTQFPPAGPLGPADALARIAQSRLRGHDAAAMNPNFRRRPSAPSETSRSNTP